MREAQPVLYPCCSLSNCIEVVDEAMQEGMPIEDSPYSARRARLLRGKTGPECAGPQPEPEIVTTLCLTGYTCCLWLLDLRPRAGSPSSFHTGQWVDEPGRLPQASGGLLKGPRLPSCPSTFASKAFVPMMCCGDSRGSERGRGCLGRGTAVGQECVVPGT